jgi:hypothetical protein
MLPGTEQQSKISKRTKEWRGKSEYKLILNKYNTNYEARRLADSTALAFRFGKILLKLITTSG